MIVNLISNAVKYSAGGTTINVACITTGYSVQISIKDEGYEIKPKDQGKLFERYYHVDSKYPKMVSELV